MKTKPGELVSSPSRPPIDFTKKWSNGHKCFTSAQSRAHVELLHTEERTKDRFDEIKLDFAKPRNPMNGEITPRDIRGETILNPSKLNTAKGGIPLFPPDRDLSASMALVNQRTKVRSTAKIGVANGKYDVLGNTSNLQTPAEDLFHTVKIETEAKQKLQEEQQRKNEFIAAEKAKRYQKDLERQMNSLKRQMEEKETELHLLQKHFQ